ncbi:hypothetical protein I3F57_06050 [Lacticaseibacillus paracasei subsp. tolerans]|nr:hypothetical protein [Lacticaseibacillus paracasei]QPI89305.1 hypothetical protein I3F57_06050 [Lacticaseibacillus paracasei subsp. tolerans]
MKKDDDDLDKRIDRFDKKLLGDYLIPILVSAVTTIILLTIFYSAK